MRLIILTFLFILFSSNFSLANNDNKITIEIIENIFFGDRKKYPFINKPKVLSKEWTEFNRKSRENYKTESNKKRREKRGIARCFHQDQGSLENYRKCNAKVIRAVLTYPEKSKKKRPGDIFYALVAINGFNRFSEEGRAYTKWFEFSPGDKPKPGMVCTEYKNNKTKYGCKAFKKSTYKKIEKFRKDPSNEKVLGHKLVKYIKNDMMMKNISDRIGVKSRGYMLLGDMLNDLVLEVKTNELDPELKLRRSLLNKYLLLLNDLEKKLTDNDYKKVDGQISKVSKSFAKIKNIQIKTKKLTNIDKAINIIFEINDIIIKSAEEAKVDKNQRNIAISLIHFMKDLVDSILFTIPEKYYVETKALSEDLWTDFDLEQLEIALDKMIKKNNEIKTERLNNSLEVISKNFQSVDAIKMIESLEGFGFPSRLKNQYRDDSALDIANEAVRDNLNNEIFKKVTKTLQQIDTDRINELAREASESAAQIAKEVSNSQQTKSFLDRKIGNHSMKTLIGAHRRGYIDLGIGNR
jgi:hypothetical protein